MFKKKDIPTKNKIPFDRFDDARLKAYMDMAAEMGNVKTLLWAQTLYEVRQLRKELQDAKDCTNCLKNLTKGINDEVMDKVAKGI